MSTTTPPALLFAFVPTRVFKRWSASEPDARFRLAIAPTGYGKTVLLSQLYAQAQQQGKQALWLDFSKLEDADSSLMAALTGLIEQDRNSHKRQALSADELAARLGATDQALAVFVDAFESGGTEQTVKLMQSLSDACQGRLQWTIASRQPLPVEEIQGRLSGWLLEVFAKDLAFDMAELRDLLGSALCEQLQQAGLEALLVVSEGWPAAIRLFALRCQGHDAPTQVLHEIRDNDAEIAQLLRERVMNRIPADLHPLLMELSLLPSFDEDLCVRLSRQDDALGGLRRLRQTHSFLLPLGASDQTVRFHPLFRAFLRREARLQLSPQSRLEFLNAAAVRYESRQQWAEAVEVRRAADDVPGLIDSLERSVVGLVRDQGRLDTCIDCVEWLQQQGFETGLLTHFWYVWALVFRRRYSYATNRADALEQRLRMQIQRGDNNDLARQLLKDSQVIRACIAVYSDQLGQTYALAGKWLQENQSSDAFHVGTATALQAIFLIDRCQVEQAQALLRSAYSDIWQSRSRYGWGWIKLFEALCSLRQGDAPTASTVLAESMGALRAELGDDAPLASSLALVRAKAAHLQGLDEEAETLLLSALTSAQVHGYLDILACGLEVAVSLWMGTAQERARMAQITHLANGYPPPIEPHAALLPHRRIVAPGALVRSI